MPRAVSEWIGKTPDAKVPPRVRLRIWNRENGVCHLSARKILTGDKWDLDHKIALVNGGEHRESNLFPALRDKHREKTKKDVAEKAKVAAMQAKHIGVASEKPKIANRGFPKIEKPRAIEKRALAEIGPSAMQRRFGV